MIPFQQALDSVLEHALSIKTEKVQLNDAIQRVLSVDIHSPFPSPAFDNSAMDGFAVDVKDFNVISENPINKLECVGKSRAGKPFDGIINKGECVKCMTGAIIPNGTNAIVKVEDTSGFESEIIKFHTLPVKYQNIRKKGEEVNVGELILNCGTSITPELMGVLTHFGIEEVEVFKKINIHLITTGDEVVNKKGEINNGSVYNSNAETLIQLLKVNYCNVIHSHVSDDKNEMVKQLSNINRNADIIITTGGISMGEFDFVKQAFAESNFNEVFWKVAQKPGKPLFFGKSDKSIAFGLPGNPISAIICFYIYVLPFIFKTLCLKLKTEFNGKLSEPFKSDKIKHRFLFGKFWIDKEGFVKCKPTEKLGSHMITSITNSNCILSSPPRHKLLTKNNLINIKPL